MRAPWFAVAIALLAGAASAASATANSYFWRREVLLGGNEREHHYLVYQHASPSFGLGATTFDSLFVYERSNTDPYWLQRTLLRAVASAPDGGPSEDQEQPFEAALDLTQYLVDHNVRPAFFVSGSESLGIDAHGLYYHERSVRSYVMTDAELRTWIDLDLPSPVAHGGRRVVGAYRATASPDPDTGPVIYLMVLSGVGMDEGGEIEAIVPVTESKLDDAVQDVKKRVAAARKPRPAHK